MITTVTNGLCTHYPAPKLKVKQCVLWTFLYTVIWALFGKHVTIGALFIQTVFVPLAFLTSQKFRCSLIYLNLLRIPFINHENPKNFKLYGARNIYVTHQSKVNNCNVNLGVWHILPKSVYVKNKQFIDEARKEETNKLFDEELRATKVPVFLYFHGITHTRALLHRVELYNLLQDLDVHVIAFDYRGFGDSTMVVPTKMGMVEDSLVVYSWLRDLVGREKPVFVWAHSQGTGISLRCFSKLDHYTSVLGLPPMPLPRALILEASYNNIYEALDKFPVTKLFNWMPHFNQTVLRAIRQNPDVRVIPEEYVRSLTAIPVLMLHACDDKVIPFQLGTKLYGNILRSRKDTEERPIFKQFTTGGHEFICRDKALPSIVQNFIKTY